MADRKRVAYIDLAKGIGMVLVLCGHLQNDTVFSFSPYIQGFCRWIFSFHMPMFFIISGMLFALKGEIPGMKAFFRKRFSSIMVPYFLFSAIYFLIIIYGVFVSHSMSIGDMYLQLWYALCFYGINVLWFLPALFFAELLFAFLVKKFSGKKRWIVMILLTVAALAINEARGFLPKEVFWWQRLDELIVTLIRPVIACSFVTVGYLTQGTVLLAPKKLITGASRRTRSSGSRFCADRSGTETGPGPLFAVIFAAVNLAAVIFNSPVDLRSLVLNNYLLYYAGAVSGSLLIILICRLIMSVAKKENAFPILRFFGRNSLVFMAVHNNPVIWIASLQCAMFVNQFVTRARGYISYVVVVAVFLVYVSLMILLINRFLPVLAGKRRG